MSINFSERGLKYVCMYVILANQHMACHLMSIDWLDCYVCLKLLVFSFLWLVVPVLELLSRNQIKFIYIYIIFVL